MMLNNWGPITLLCTVLLAYVAVTRSQHVGLLHHAIAIIRGKSGVSGNLRFRENEQGKVNIRGTIEGLVKGPHGIHIHQFGDLFLGCQSAGGHFDVHLNGSYHGARNDSNGHTGDFGNVIAGDTGVANVYINNSFIELHGDASIVGRAVLVHAGRDDLGQGGNDKSLETGNAGPPVACGIVAWDD
ncbi:unnamed protein product [Oppiella nova]|uniref:Superoxide dismutase copper/zinc binding domain-containing protein n=1 Tax=Oppiella nova TaxID=334625 RepID=A0A7R9QN56_9ACAR|nr:unnamed protein product [Oppiella nova]CAG2168903.1 unnamed protein product [Oppiella nova]